MCGISGFLDTSGQLSQSELESRARAMADTLRHRGPDDAGVWADAGAGVALSHRRLSIIDLSSEGHQPMRSVCGRYVVTFNGEIYNFQELRSELDAKIQFRGHSDTEVMLAAFTEWGIEATVKRLNGMFAFAVWDGAERTLSLVRDRLGEKPLYYGWSGKSFLFASELKAIRGYPGFAADVNRDALSLFFRHNYIPGPYSIYKGVLKLPQASMVTIDPRRPGDCGEVRSYWSLLDAVRRGHSDPIRESGDALVDLLDQTLRESVKSRMCADVPLGAFLSGGVDSSTVVALMQAQSDRPVRTFSIGFCNEGYDEASYARAVADHLGTDHTELYVTPSETMGVVPKLPELYDEPFSDASQIPTFIVSTLARRHVTVSLSGDGGDELFGGYKRFMLADRLWSAFGRTPPGLRRAVGSALLTIPRPVIDKSLSWAMPMMRRKGLQGDAGDQIRRIVESMRMPSRRLFYRDLISHWKSPDKTVLGAVEPANLLAENSRDEALASFLDEMMYIDTLTYLPDDVLVKVDRASMAVALEARVPFLDHRLVELAWRLPREEKLKDGKSKLLLRKVLHRYVPPAMVERPKMGFTVPIGQWLRGPLRDWAESLLDADRIKQEGYLDVNAVRRRWDEHVSGKWDWRNQIWDVLMFQAWLEANR